MLNRRITLVLALTLCILYYLFYSSSGPATAIPNASYDILNPSSPSPPHYTRTAIVLTCEGRSGSTWLSSLFWRHPNVFYVYEPLFPSVPNDNAVDTMGVGRDAGKIHQLLDGFQCNLDHSKGETKFPMVLGRYPMYQPELKHCKDTNTCPNTLTEFCNSRSHMVQKVIRVFNISDYATLERQLHPISLKVIHLVRDPRPNIMSREKMFTYMKDESKKYKSLSPEERSRERQALCDRVLSNIKIGDSGALKHYIRVTHEEMSLAPIKTAKALYNFAGLDFTAETETYINEITHGSDLVKGGKDPDGRFAGFSVYRDTQKVLRKWMSSEKGHVHEIEKECAPLLEYIGYKPLYNDKLDSVNENPWPNL